jgi:hypothetical protein
VIRHWLSCDIPKLAPRDSSTPITVYRDPDNKRLEPTTSSQDSNSLSLILEPIIMSGVPALISELEKPRPLDKGMFETSR